MEVETFDQIAETMITDLPIKFLQQKVQELQSALFFPETGSLLKIPTHVVTAAEVDEDGQVWFIIPRPAQHMDEADMTFPAKLDFFRKGKGFFLKVTGKAYIVCEAASVKCRSIPEEIIQRLKSKQAVAIKVIIQSADYFENVARPTSSRNQSSKYQQFFTWLLKPQNELRSPQLITIPIPVDR
jgi:hypothetical protein